MTPPGDRTGQQGEQINLTIGGKEIALPSDFNESFLNWFHQNENQLPGSTVSEVKNAVRSAGMTYPSS